MSYNDDISEDEATIEQAEEELAQTVEDSVRQDLQREKGILKINAHMFVEQLIP